MRDYSWVDPRIQRLTTPGLVLGLVVGVGFIILGNWVYLAGGHGPPGLAWAAIAPWGMGVGLVASACGLWLLKRSYGQWLTEAGVEGPGERH